MRCVGLDLSLTAPGIAGENGPLALRDAKNLRGSARLSFYYDYFHNMVFPRCDVALVEGYAFGSAFGREALGELGGVVKLAAIQRDVPLVIVPPTVVKKYATGKGNANKDVVLAAAIKRSGLDIDDNNAADAWWLYQIGCSKYFPSLAVEMPALNKSALDKIEWPL